ncbi:MAG: peptidoglycan DD-metalloendopeptidase family protein [Bacteroidales bacterium]|nr:peptidoglycan DD-metalloendopeptidase family protein [Bacteroidales bacterium]
MKHLLTILLAILCCLPAPAQSLSRTRDRKARLERDIRTLEKQLSATRSKESNAAGQLDLLRAQSSARRELLQESERELRIITDSVRRCRAQVEALSARIDTLEARYGVLVHNAYKSRDSRVWYMYILASENIGQGFRRYGYLRRLSSELNHRGHELKVERDTLTAVQQRLELLRADARKLRDQRAGEVEKLRREEERSRVLVSQLQNERKKYLTQLSGKRKEVEALNREIERLIAAEVDGTGKGGKKNGNTGGKKTSTKIDTALSKEFSANQGKLPWPAEGRVVSHFGRNPHPVYTKLEMPFNNGVGLALEPEAPVKAVFNGTVKQIVMIPGYNQCILVQHGEYFTFYCKLGSVAVKAGDKVKTGQVLGHVATIGDETQLHFQLWKGKTPQDPENWLKK